MPTIQKASFLKRISAYLLDVILVVILATGFAAALSPIVGYDKQSQLLDSYYTKYEQLYGVDFNITEEDFNKLTPEQQADYQTAVANAEAAMEKDKELLAVYEMVMALTLVIVSISGLLAILSVYFVVPLFLKYGQTVGKKIFGLAVMRTNCVKASNKVLFIRALFGYYAIETMFPIFIILLIYFGFLNIIGTITLLLYLILQIFVLIYTKTNSCIHDLLSDTVVIDFASQRIFETEEARLDFIKAEQAKEAEAAAY